MGTDSPLVGATVLVDANVFFAIGGPTREKYTAFRREVRRTDTVLKLPERVVGELGGPEAAPIRTALDEGWADVIDGPDPADSDAIAASDVARRTIAAETGRPEHEVEKADTVLAGLAVQSLQNTPTERIVVLTNDRPARVAIETALESLGYADAVVVHDVTAIIGDDWDDSVRLI